MSRQSRRSISRLGEATDQGDEPRENNPPQTPRERKLNLPVGEAIASIRP